MTDTQTLVDIVQHPAVKIAELYIANHLVTTAISASSRKRMIENCYPYYYRSNTPDSKKWAHCFGKRIFRLKTFIYGASATAAELGLYYLVKTI